MTQTAVSEPGAPARPLSIVVCIKPVPDPRQWSKLKLDPETMLLCRAEIPPVINPLDRNAMEAAVALREQFGGVVRVLTMAPADAEDQLIEAMAAGCDEAYLLTDRAFAGGDTLATAHCLAAAIRRLGAVDLVFCGGYSLDGSTHQVGPQLAELLELPDFTLATQLEVEADGQVRAWCKVEGGEARFEGSLPALVTVAQELNHPRLPSMTGLRRAAATTVTRWTAADLGVDPNEVGLLGSPTQMLNVTPAPGGRKGEILQGPADEIAARLIHRLRAERVLS